MDCQALHTATRRSRTIALAVLVCGLGSATPGGAQEVRPDACDEGGPRHRTAVVLHLIDRAGLSAETRQDLMRETALAWRDTGVDVRWAADDVGATGGPEHVYVTLTREGGVPRGPGFGRPLASILFVDGRPTTQISVHVGEVERLAATARFDERPWPGLPPLLRERLIGRALGRAIAHEVGHYVFASAAHASAGLMRPGHPIERLMTSSNAGFQVIPP
jgi:hypothetical protein